MCQSETLSTKTKILPKLFISIVIILFAAQINFAQPKSIELANWSVEKSIDSLSQWMIKTVLKKPKLANDYLEKAQEVVFNTEDSIQIIRVKYLEGIYYRIKRNFDIAEEKLLECESFVNRRGVIIEDLTLDLQLGLNYFNRKNHEKSIYHLLQANEKCPLESRGAKIGILSRLSLVYLDAGHVEKSLEQLQKAYESLDSTVSSRAKVNLILKLSDAFYELNNLDSSYYYAEQLSLVAEKKKFKVYTLRAQLNKASIYLRNNELDKAKPLAVQAEQGLQNVKGAHLGFFKSKNVLGKIYELENRFLKALKLYKSGYDYAEKYNFLNDQKEFAEKIIRLNKLLGQFSEVIKYHEVLSVIQDSLNVRASQESILAIKEKHESDKKDLAINLLKSEKQINLLSLNKSKHLIIFGIIVIALLVFLATLLYNLLEAKRESENILVDKNSIISKSLKDKEILLREIHHRVKNNLQVISSLLSIQSRYIKDPLALDAITEGRNRVRSMAIIHQDLYKNKNLTGVDVEEYFEKLIESLFNSYKTSEEKILLELDIDNIQLDVDTIVPIGLILNELISNALKYAFPNDRYGKIKVYLNEFENHLQLRVEDDGIGIDDIEKMNQGDSFGYELIDAFAHKLDAKLTIESHKGTCITLKINKYQKAV